MRYTVLGDRASLHAIRQPAATAFQFQETPSGGEELGERLRRRYQRQQAR